MTPTTHKHDDTKILLVVAGAVVAGAAGLAFLAGMGGGEAELPESTEPRAATVDDSATAEPAVFFKTREEPREVESMIENASLSQAGEPTVSTGDPAQAEVFEIAPGENLVAGGLKAWNAGDYDRAVAYFAAQTEARESDAWAHYMVGLAQWKAGRADEAAAAMRRSAELDPAFIRTPINLSRIENDRGDFEAALSAAQAAVAIDGENADARFLEGRSWNNMGRSDAAVVALEKSLDLSDTNGFAHNLLGLIRLDQGDFEAAADALERAAELEPNVAFVHNNLGMALELCGDREGAVVAYRRAVDVGGSVKAESNLARLEPATPESEDETVAAAKQPDEEQPDEDSSDGVVETADAGALD